jgi:hypothetical protein
MRVDRRRTWIPGMNEVRRDSGAHEPPSAVNAENFVESACDCYRAAGEACREARCTRDVVAVPSRWRARLPAREWAPALVITALASAGEASRVPRVGGKNFPSDRPI